MERVLGKALPDCLTYLGFRGVAQVEHTRGCREIRHGAPLKFNLIERNKRAAKASYDEIRAFQSGERDKYIHAIHSWGFVIVYLIMAAAFFVVGFVRENNPDSAVAFVGRRKRTDWFGQSFRPFDRRDRARARTIKEIVILGHGTAPSAIQQILISWEAPESSFAKTLHISRPSTAWAAIILHTVPAMPLTPYWPPPVYV